MHAVASAALALNLLAAPPLYAAGPTGMPSPGHYRIDTEATTTSRAGPTTLETVQRIDGATGRVTLTQKSSVDPTNVPTQTANGTGPNRRCVPASGAVPPTKSAPPACQNALRTATPAGSTLGADCNIGRVDEQWRRIDDRTWERSLTVRQSPIASMASNSSPGAAIEFAMQGMTPAQRAGAKAELAATPSAAEVAKARGTLVATLEQQVRSGSAEEAAAARQQLGALGASPSGSADVVVRSKERWIRIAETCPAGG